MPLSPHLARFALDRCAREPYMVAHWLIRYQLARTLLDEAAIAADLGLDMEALVKLATCRVPVSEADVATVAAHCGMTPAALESMLETAGYRRL